MLLSLLIASVIINEVAWMGTDVSYNDEWIELKNNTEESINLENWSLKAEDGTPEIALSGIIPDQGFYLLERTDDETVAGIPADLIYTGALGNKGEHLKLYDDLGNLIDQVDCTDTWPAGDNSTKQTMERINSGWQTSQDSSGTPKAENSKLEKMEEHSPLPVPEEKYPKGVIFQEIMPSPDGPDAENEWIKIYNQNDFDIDLSGWVIQDIIGRTTAYALNTKIKKLSSLILSRIETKITLNNDGDKLELINPNKETVDSVSFEKASQGQLYIRTGSGWEWKTKERVEKITETGSLSAKKETNQIVDLSQEKNSKFPLILIALIVSLISAGVVVSLSNRLSGDNRLGRDKQNRF